MHFGNLRTAVASWLLAKTTGRQFLVRVEDIDSARSRPEYASAGLQDLLALGIRSEGPVVYQSTRTHLYQEALDHLVQKNLVYECYCSRADVAAAASAPHITPGIYPGTCRNLSEQQRKVKREELAEAGRLPALRLRAPQGIENTVRDAYLGPLTGMVHDCVLRRSDGDWAYQLVVVVDDMAQGVDQVVRGADLASSAPMQAWMTEILGGLPPKYAHVPLVLNDQGKRLAKRDRSVTRPELGNLGWSDQQILLKILETLGWKRAKEEWMGRTVQEILDQAVQSWAHGDLPKEPVIFHA